MFWFYILWMGIRGKLCLLGPITHQYSTSKCYLPWTLSKFAFNLYWHTSRLVDTSLGYGVILPGLLVSQMLEVLTVGWLDLATLERPMMIHYTVLPGYCSLSTFSVPAIKYRKVLFGHLWRVLLCTSIALPAAISLSIYSEYAHGLLGNPLCTMLSSPCSISQIPVILFALNSEICLVTDSVGTLILHTMLGNCSQQSW